MRAVDEGGGDCVAGALRDAGFSNDLVQGCEGMGGRGEGFLVVVMVNKGRCCGFDGVVERMGAEGGECESTE